MQFVALLSRSSDPTVSFGFHSQLRSRLRQSEQWNELDQCGSFTIWTKGASVDDTSRRWQNSTHEKSCTVFGLAFEKTEGEIDPFFFPSEHSYQSIVSTSGKWLFAEAWGDYVVIISSMSGGRPLVIRSPTGNQACYYIALADQTLFFSDFRDVEWVLPNREINEKAFVATTLNARLDKAQTCLVGVQEVLPGEVWSDQTTVSNRLIGWSPYDFMASEQEASVDSYSKGLRRVLIKTARSLASQYEEILLPIGGLDSSVVLACLRHCRPTPNIKLLTFLTEEKAGDEYRYTNAVAQHFGIDLDRRVLDAGGIDFDAVMSSNRQPKPERVFDFGDLAATPRRGGAYGSIEAVFTGVGGDTMLLQSPGLFPTLDHVNRYGFSNGLWNVMRSTMRASQQSLFRVVLAAVQERLASEDATETITRFLEVSRDGRWFSDAYAGGHHLADHLPHPGLLSNKVHPKGKVLQALLNSYMPMTERNPLNHFGELPHHHLYWTQPVIEACLGIPSWILALNGMDRGLVRYAFREDLPSEMLQRYTKGTPASIYHRFVADNEKNIRDVLMSGLNRRRGAFSEEWMRLLEQENGLAEIPNFFLLHTLNMESWATSVGHV